eukprot:13603486-Ditylum_brightwellii.AAC.1
MEPKAKLEYQDWQYLSPDVQLDIQVDGAANGSFNPERIKFDFTAEPQQTFGSFSGAYHSATDTPHQSAEVAPSDKPVDGPDVPFSLRLSFEEAYHGCKKSVEYPHNTNCKHCSGTGKKHGRQKHCVQCHGKGFVQLPSEMYMIKKECGFCSGDGVYPAPKCGRCGGAGVVSKNEVRVIHIPPGVVSMSRWTMRGWGHQGARGG